MEAPASCVLSTCLLQASLRTVSLKWLLLKKPLSSTHFTVPGTLWQAEHLELREPQKWQHETCPPTLESLDSWIREVQRSL